MKRGISQSGFTLIELMVVVSIIGVLTAIVVPVVTRHLGESQNEAYASEKKQIQRLVDQYLAYTYPYVIFHRLDAIIPELERRNVHGIIHYVQSFCHRHIEDLVLRKKLSLPILTLEGETPGNVDERTKIRLQAFIEMLGA